ncbi:KH domain-containing protein [Bacillus suaedae]|uniref:RNA-binding protein KhpA n=1 Tax=Halalkalibacter suaedae TaxID=2822140 RepID=A0A941APR3_9BACI|nr:KH domain-containing protein [Bacillus suaedae]MBP3952061.1 KH domain-containing protein [Bacillus suaedae]
MKPLLEHMVKALVDHPDEIQVKEVIEGQTLRLQLFVHTDDIGKVIGKQGKTARAIRTVLSAAPSPHKRVQLDIME